MASLRIYLRIKKRALTIKCYCVGKLRPRFQLCSIGKIACTTLNCVHFVVRAFNRTDTLLLAALIGLVIQDVPDQVTV